MDNLASTIKAAELEVMCVFWKHEHSLPLADIRRELSERCEWEDSTIKTLLRRLCAKGVVKLEQRGIYSAVVTEAEYHRWSNQNYVSKLFEGSAKRLVASLMSNGQLSQEDIAELSSMFNGEDYNE
jgi:BlaI family penicillinase repressor